MQTFRKDERLCNRRIITSLMTQGESFFIHPFVVKWMECPLQSEFPAQVVFSVPRKNISSAVNRNRVRRRVREAYRKNKDAFYEVLRSHKRECAFALIYTSKDFITYAEAERKIILILQRLQMEYEKVTG
ncbi:MAG: ribonuclease P protein component [Bacteroidota bacterium]